MRVRQMTLTLALSTGSLVSAAMAQDYRGTWAQQMACTPDVWRLCSSQIPDVNRIVACLHDNTAQLSDGCRAVFTSNDSVPQPTQPVHRGEPAARISR